MESRSVDRYTAPVFLGMAFVVFGFAIVEKALNLFGANLPFVNVYPRQLLYWTVSLLIFEITITLRQALGPRG